METTSRKVMNLILKKIELGEFKIGDKLPSERELALKFNVSRSSIREAMSALNMIGIVEIQPKGGSYIQPFHVYEFMDSVSNLLYQNENMESQMEEYRLCIEKEAVRLSLKNDDFSELDRILRKMKVCKNKKSASELDLLFHLAIAKASQNRLLIASSQAITSLMRHSVEVNRSLLAERYPDLKRLVIEHEEILSAIKEKEEDLAVQLIEKHLKVK